VPTAKATDGGGNSTRGVCIQCLAKMARDRKEGYAKNTRHSLIQNLLDQKIPPGQEDDGFWVSRKQISDWKKGKVPEEKLNADIVCGCDEMQLGTAPKKCRTLVYASAWETFQKEFPQGAHELKGSASVCQACVSEVSQAKDVDRDRKRNRKPSVQQHKAIMNAANVMTNPNCSDCFLVSRAWLDLWAIWARDEADDIPLITDQGLKCEHGKLLFRPVTDGGVYNGTEDYVDNFVLLSHEHWERLTSIQGLAGVPAVKADMEVCDECRDARIKSAENDACDFDEYSIQVQNMGMFADAEAPETRSSEAQKADPDVVSSSKPEEECATGSVPRRARRPRRDKTVQGLRSSSSDSLMQFKTKICDIFGICPSQQRLRVKDKGPDGIETERSLCLDNENDQSLKELQLKKNMKVYVWTMPFDDTTSSQPAVETGFAGTGLFGGTCS
jgi:hypothetical protein